MAEQPSLAIEPAGVPSERSVAADQPMARDDDGHGVLSIGQADCTRRGRAADRGGELAVGLGGAGRNFPERAPDRLLKLRAARIHLDLIQSVKVAREVGLDPSADAEGVAAAMKHETPKAA